VDGEDDATSFEQVTMMNRTRWTPALQQRMRSWLMLGLATLAILQLAIWSVVLSGEGPDLYVRHHTDFLHILTGALIVREGHGTQLYDLAQQQMAQNAILAPYLVLDPGMILPYNHPPFEAILLAPLLTLPYPLLFALDDLFALAAIGVSLWLLVRTLPLPATARTLLIAAVLSYHPFHIALWSGQTSPLLLLGAVGVYVAMKRRSEVWVAVALLPLTLKPQVLPPILLLLLLTRYWRSIALWIGILCTGSVAAMPILGAGWPLQYLRFVSEAAQLGERAYTDATHMPTVRGVFANLAGERFQYLVSPLALALAGAGLVLIVGIWVRSRGMLKITPPGVHGAFDYLWGATTLIAIATAIHLGPHDLVLLLLPVWIGVAALLAQQPERASYARLAYGALVGLYGIPLLMLFSPRAIVLIIVPVLTLTGIFARWTLRANVSLDTPVAWQQEQDTRERRTVVNTLQRL